MMASLLTFYAILTLIVCLAKCSCQIEQILQQHRDSRVINERDISEIIFSLCKPYSHRLPKLFGPLFGWRVLGVSVQSSRPMELDLKFMLFNTELEIETNTKNVANDHALFRFNMSLLVLQRPVGIISQSCVMLTSNNLTAAYHCKLVVVERVKNLIATLHSWSLVNPNSSLDNFQLMLKEEYFDSELVLPLCSQCSSAALSQYLQGSGHLHRHLVVGCTGPLMNIDKLEMKWPGLIRQWLQHHVYMTRFGYISVYDVDGTAWKFVKEFVELGLVRYYGSFHWSERKRRQLVADLSNDDSFVANSSLLNSFVANHCLWTNKDHSISSIMLRSPEYWIAQRKFAYSAFNMPNEIDHVLIPVVNHSIRFFPTDDKKRTSIFQTYPFVSETLNQANYLSLVNTDTNIIVNDETALSNIFRNGSSEAALMHPHFVAHRFPLETEGRVSHQTSTAAVDRLTVDNALEQLSNRWGPSMEALHEQLLKFIDTSSEVHMVNALLDDLPESSTTMTNGSLIQLLVVAPGLIEIPPVGYGAVEIIIWNYYLNLPRHMFNVTIVNTNMELVVMKTIEEIKPDIIHLQIESWAYLADRMSSMAKLVIMTFHGPLFADPTKWEAKISKHFTAVSLTCRMIPNIYFFVISSKHQDVFIKKWFIPPERVILIPNGVDLEEFIFHPIPKYGEMSVAVGKIHQRKGQYFLQSILPIDEVSFVGPKGDCTHFDFSAPNYFGPWKKDELHRFLTYFGNLVHLATDEGAPLVVLEALAAGLGVVTTVNASANLDLTKPFITVIPDHKMFDKDYVLAAIRKNRELSLMMREEIREYARQTFSWSEVIVPQYASITRNLLIRYENGGIDHSWMKKYHLTETSQSNPPYIAVVTFLHHCNSRITHWIDTLRILGVDYFLFYTVHSNDDKMLPLLKDYIAEGVVEVQYVTDFAYYHSLDDTGKMNIFDDNYFHVLCMNEAVAYFRFVGIAWHVVLYEQGYLYENEKYSNVVRNALRFYLKQQEQRNVDILVIHGHLAHKYDKNVSFINDNRLHLLHSSRSFANNKNIHYHGLNEINCINIKHCIIESVGQFIDIPSPIDIAMIDVDYAYMLEQQSIISSADDEIALVAIESMKAYPALHTLQEVADKVRKGRHNSVCNNNNNMIVYITVYQYDEENNEYLLELFLNGILSFIKPLIVFMDNLTLMHLNELLIDELPSHIYYRNLDDYESTMKKNEITLVHDIRTLSPGCSYYGFISSEYIASPLIRSWHLPLLLPQKVTLTYFSNDEHIVKSRVEGHMSVDDIHMPSIIIPNMLVSRIFNSWSDDDHDRAPCDFLQEGKQYGCLTKYLLASYYDMLIFYELLD